MAAGPRIVLKIAPELVLNVFSWFSSSVGLVRKPGDSVSSLSIVKILFLKSYGLDDPIKSILFSSSTCSYEFDLSSSFEVSFRSIRDGSASVFIAIPVLYIALLFLFLDSLSFDSFYTTLRSLLCRNEGFSIIKYCPIILS